MEHVLRNLRERDTIAPKFLGPKHTATYGVISGNQILLAN